jgi:hypothetical protein
VQNVAISSAYFLSLLKEWWEHLHNKIMTPRTVSELQSRAIKARTLHLIDQY